MRSLLTIIFSLFISIGFGQQVNAPDAKEFTLNTAGQNASGFSLSGFNSTATLLCAVGLPNTVAGTSFYFTTTTGVTASTGYTMSGNKTRISFTGTQANINAVLASMKINTGGTNGSVNISVSATINPTGYFYNPNNGHFYRPISTGANFANAITLSSQQTFKGQTGYLVTITSNDEDLFIFNNVPQSNIWFAADDRTTEGRWVISAGPEVNTLLRIGNASGTNQQGVYNNWAGGEPNDWGGNEDAAVTKWGGAFSWNDLSVANVNAYVVEFGTWTNPDDQTFTEFYNNSVLHSNGPDLNLKGLFNFNFGGNIDETKFSARLSKRNDTLSNWVNGSFVTLNGLGRVNLSTQLDTAKVFSSAIQAATQNDMQAYTTSDIGKIYKMTITGGQGGAVWGTDIYTNDSYIPMAAIHAGVITAGQTKEVYIQIVEGLNNYPSSTRNGITTSDWGSWGLSYKFVSQPSSYKANTSAGQVEWCVIYDYDASNQRYRVGIDKREYGNVASNTVTQLKLFDLWDGPVTFKSDDGTWAEYWINTSTQFNFSGSSFASKIRQGNGFYGVSAEFTFALIGSYKQHKLVFNDYDSTQLKSLYGSIVTVSDVYLAFKELANGGIFGNQSGNEFGYGIQFDNADVDEDGVFDESDCFDLLQDLVGKKSLVSSYTLDNTMKIILDTTYGQIGKSTWAAFPSHLGKEYEFSLQDNKTNYTYNLAVTWKGDVNLSHSATPPSNGVTTSQANFGMKNSKTNLDQVNASILTEMIGDDVFAYITFNPSQETIAGTQFQLYYDNSILKYSNTEYITNGSPTNYTSDKGNFINLGSLNTDGSEIKNATYKIKFTTKQKIVDGILGLVSMGNSEAVNKDGKSILIKIM